MTSRIRIDPLVCRAYRPSEPALDATWMRLACLVARFADEEPTKGRMTWVMTWHGVLQVHQMQCIPSSRRASTAAPVSVVGVGAQPHRI